MTCRSCSKRCAEGRPCASALISPCAAEGSALTPRSARLVARRQEEGEATETSLSVLRPVGSRTALIRPSAPGLPAKSEDDGLRVDLPRAAPKRRGPEEAPVFARLVARRQEEGEATETSLSVLRPVGSRTALIRPSAPGLPAKSEDDGLRVDLPRAAPKRRGPEEALVFARLVARRQEEGEATETSLPVLRPVGSRTALIRPSAPGLPAKSEDDGLRVDLPRAAPKRRGPEEAPVFARLVARRQEEGEATETSLSVLRPVGSRTALIRPSAP